ncbi:MAG: hypothetical protein HZB65_04170 [Candidatus Aenigmarchaeota archaeon]|nr:hypothetical protein [Candidatus Aenigmarchaeota archaeon]
MTRKMKGAIPWIMLSLLIIILLALITFPIMYQLVMGTAGTAKSAGGGILSDLGGIAGAFFYIG